MVQYPIDDDSISNAGSLQGRYGEQRGTLIIFRFRPATPRLLIHVVPYMHVEWLVVGFYCRSYVSLRYTYGNDLRIESDLLLGLLRKTVPYW